MVNLAQTENEKSQIVERYQSILGRIPDRQFDFRGALKWSQDLAC